MEKTKSIYVKEKKSKIHGTGIYATRDIPKNTYVLEYVGEKVTKKQSDQIAQDLLDKYEKNKKKYAGVFLFTLNSRFAINGNVKHIRFNSLSFLENSIFVKGNRKTNNTCPDTSFPVIELAR